MFSNPSDKEPGLPSITPPLRPARIRKASEHKDMLSPAQQKENGLSSSSPSGSQNFQGTAGYTGQEDHRDIRTEQEMHTVLFIGSLPQCLPYRQLEAKKRFTELEEGTPRFYNEILTQIVCHTPATLASGVKRRLVFLISITYFLTELKMVCIPLSASLSCLPILRSEEKELVQKLFPFLALRIKRYTSTNNVRIICAVKTYMRFVEAHATEQYLQTLGDEKKPSMSALRLLSGISPDL